MSALAPVAAPHHAPWGVGAPQPAEKISPLPSPNFTRPFRLTDLEALELIQATVADGTPLKLARLLSRVRKDYARGMLAYGPHETPQHAWGMCEARLMLGVYDDWHGWQFRNGWAAGWAANRVKDGVMRWRGERVSRLHVYGEQGIGDEVFFSQALPFILGKVDSVVIETDPRLKPVLERSFANVEVKPWRWDYSRAEDDQRLMHPVDGDAWTLLGDLIVRSGPQGSLGGYLKAAPEQVERFSHYAGRIGVSWRGHQGHFACKDFIAGVHDADGNPPLSLQYDQGWDEDVERPVDRDGAELDLRNDIEGIFGLLANLSSVKSVSTSVAHFACALGVETFVQLTPRNGLNSRGKCLMPWKWLQRGGNGRTRWYGTARVRGGCWARSFPGGPLVGFLDRLDGSRGADEGCDVAARSAQGC